MRRFVDAAFAAYAWENVVGTEFWNRISGTR
jgi:hypothetical protein